MGGSDDEDILSAPDKGILDNSASSRQNGKGEAPLRSTQRPVTIAPVVDNKLLRPANVTFNEPDGDDKNQAHRLRFRDGLRSVDFVLVWEPGGSATATERRRIFQANLQREGLQLEAEPPEPSELCFVKIHAPLEVLRRYTEILKLRMPMSERFCGVHTGSQSNLFLQATMFLSQKIPGLRKVQRTTHTCMDQLSAMARRCMSQFHLDKKLFPEKKQRFTAVYSRDRDYLFDDTKEEFFNPSTRSRIVQFILDRKRFSEDPDDDFAFGIERLISERGYIAAYPLHDGDLCTAGSQRHLLYTEWAAVGKCLRYQPLDQVKDYFGVKIALYFAWLGFYTHMLVPAAIVGVLCFVYGWLTLPDNKPSRDICNKDLNIKMCPLCDHFCDYWDLEETCLHAQVTYLFDNPTTVFFAIFMSFWATMFLELWKRYSAEITHRWDLTGFDVKEEHPRPQYLARLAHVKRKDLNIVTNTFEPHVPFWRMKLPATILSFSVVLLLVALAVAAVLGVVLYRMSVLAALSVYGDSVITSYAMLFTTATAATINLGCIMLFNLLYTRVAKRLTEVELLRTQTEFDDSLTLKIYLLQFVNYYASIFYIAFFKGRFVGHPNQYNRLFQYRQEECGPGGCLMELCIQLAIIMIGKQAMNTVLEMLWPLFYKWINTMRVKTGLKKGQSHKGARTQWLRDFKLVEWGPRGLFPEYLEMVLQYGFVTIFVAAFPLAPFFALVNNVFEMRLDAKKLITFYRRPVTQRVRDIGVWFRILDSIGKLSVITNGFIIAFTSTFIPKMVYMSTVSRNYSLDGFLNHSLAYFDTNDLEIDSAFRSNVTECRYPDYREPHWVKEKYEKTAMYWHVLAARLAFIVVFENAVVLVMMFVRWCIPDASHALRDQIRREAYITNEIVIKHEAERVRAIDRTPDGAVNGALPPQWHTLSGSELDLVIREQMERSFYSPDSQEAGVASHLEPVYPEDNVV